MIVELNWAEGEQADRWFHCKDVLVTTKDGKVHVRVFDGQEEAKFTAERASVYGDGGVKMNDYGCTEFG